MLVVKVDKYFYKILYFLFKTQYKFKISFYTSFSNSDCEYVELMFDEKNNKFVAIINSSDYCLDYESSNTFNTLTKMFQGLEYKYYQVLFATKKELEPFNFYGLKSNNNKYEK